MIENEEAVIADSLWTATANPAPVCPPLRGREEAEVAIIGAGYTGLSAALHLAERGVSVVVLEAETPGWGASGRNGGQVNPGLKGDPDELEARFGAEMGRRMTAFSGDAGTFTFDLIDRLGIDCDAARVGWVQTFRNETGEATIRSRVAQWNRRGVPLRLLSREETAATIGMALYRGAMLDPRGGNLHPLNYALGLAQAVQRAGGRIHGQSRVLSLITEGAGHVLRTPAGELRARQVLIGTNGYADAVSAPMNRAVVPVRSVQVATAPLPPEIAETILPQGHSPSDGRRLVLYYRKGPGGRFVMGGRGDYGAAATARHMQALRETSVEMFPQLAGIGWEHGWGGFVAMTADHYPHLTRIRPGVMAAMGYNGRGVALATVMGKLLADWASGAAPEALPFPVTAPRPIPFHILRRPAVAAVVAWSRLRDRMDG